eukprot:gb/GECG01016777.1/.p1 GENE.gb/GECG01016777.1/~~gb/GECG01016777.1/.p1  ORF type:complete len:107 (+),score=10.30 gb/GECG01016777.1/:1-321(+)
MSRSLIPAARRVIQQQQAFSRQCQGIFARRFASGSEGTATAPAPASEEDHKKFVDHAVKNYPVEDIKHFEFSTEFLLGVPVPHHQFEQPPILIEVHSRNPEFGHDH